MLSDLSIRQAKPRERDYKLSDANHLCRSPPPALVATAADAMSDGLRASLVLDERIDFARQISVEGRRRAFDGLLHLRQQANGR